MIQEICYFIQNQSIVSMHELLSAFAVDEHNMRKILSKLVLHGKLITLGKTEACCIQKNKCKSCSILHFECYKWCTSDIKSLLRRAYE